jgi:hypothetical protein
MCFLQQRGELKSFTSIKISILLDYSECCDSTILGLAASSETLLARTRSIAAYGPSETCNESILHTNEDKYY